MKYRTTVAIALGLCFSGLVRDAGAAISGTTQFNGIECAAPPSGINQYQMGINGFGNVSSTEFWAVCPLTPPSHDSEAILRSANEVRIYYAGPQPSGAFITYYLRGLAGIYFSPSGFVNATDLVGSPHLRLESAFMFEGVEASMEIWVGLPPSTTIMGGGAHLTVGDIRGGT